MILVADSGSTKTDWVLTDGKELRRYATVGYNPYFVGTDAIYESLSNDLASKFEAACVKKIFFYGAGCSTSENKSIAHAALSRCFTNAIIIVGHDMLAAARALLGNNNGFAAIIGTGSNTCIYNGKDIEHNIDSLGYLLGDEGSGSYIGKKIVRDFMRGYLPTALQDGFYQQYKLQPSDIFEALYNKPTPNRFLAGFCRFAVEHKESDHIKEIVKDSFTDFFAHQVSRYPGYKQYAFNCVGSVGYIFKEQLAEVAGRFNMHVGKLIASPIDELVTYHLPDLQ